MSQDQLAEMLGVSQQAVANWEAGVSMPRRERRARLLQILGPSSQLATNPPRYEFVPSEDREVSQSTRSLAGAHSPPENMPASPAPEPHRPRPANPTLFEDARRRIELNMARHHAQQEEFIHALPPELRPYVDGHITVGATTRRLDYLSPRRGIEIKRAPSNKFMSWSHAAPALLTLAVARSIADQGLRPPRDYTLILVNEGVMQPGASGMQRLMFDAGVLGISVYQVESFAQAGALIADLEAEGEGDLPDIDLDVEPPEGTPPEA